jgi:hypothetical protein
MEQAFHLWSGPQQLSGLSYITPCGFHPILDPRYEIQKGADDLIRRKLAMPEAINMTAHQPVT